MSEEILLQNDTMFDLTKSQRLDKRRLDGLNSVIIKTHDLAELISGSAHRSKGRHGLDFL